MHQCLRNSAITVPLNQLFGKYDFSEMELQIRACNRIVKFYGSLKLGLIFKFHDYYSLKCLNVWLLEKKFTQDARNWVVLHYFCFCWWFHELAKQAWVLRNIHIERKIPVAAGHKCAMCQWDSGLAGPHVWKSIATAPKSSESSWMSA